MCKQRSVALKFYKVGFIGWFALSIARDGVRRSYARPIASPAGIALLTMRGHDGKPLFPYPTEFVVHPSI